MAPVIRHLGHAGFAFSWGGVRLLIDPWFTPAFLGSWFPWPDNRQMAAEAHGDFLYVSHAHEDHFDRRFLAGLDKDIRVLVPRFPSRQMERELRALGFTDLIPLGHGEQYQVTAGFTVTMLLDPAKEDSALLVDAGGFRFLDANDCEVPASQWPGQVDVLACQFSGASWYPHCYAYPPDVMTAKTAEVRVSALERLARKVRATGARMFLPSAGPAVFLDPALAAYNDRAGIFPWWEDVRARFIDAVPGVPVIPPLRVSGTVDDYRRERRREWEAWHDQPDTPATAAEVHAHFGRLQQVNRRFLAGWPRDVTLDAGGRSWNVRLGAVPLEEDPAEPGWRIHVPPRVLRAILDGRASWETALLSMRARLHEGPGGYDSVLLGLLQAGHRPAQTRTLARLRDDGEEIERDGLVMQRWCPHAGEDLTYATVRDGTVECPRHHWRWDTATGRCTAGGDMPLRVRQAT